MAGTPQADRHGMSCPIASAWMLLTAFCLAAVVAGCGQQTAGTPDAAQANGSNETVGQGGSNTAANDSQSSSSPAAEMAAGDIWEAVLFNGQHVGYAHTAVRPASEPGHTSVDYTLSLQLQRFGDSTQPAMRVSSVQDAQGRPVRFTMSAALGEQPMNCSGQVQDGRLVIRREGVAAPQEVALQGDVLGFWGVEANLRNRPLAPGETRQFRALDPTLLTVMAHDLTAIGHEQVELLDGDSQRLLRIDLDSRLPGRLELQFRLWADQRGNILKRQSVGLGVEQTLVVTTQQRATGATAQFDLGSSSVVPVNKPIDNAHALRQIRYRVHLKSGNPAKVFPTTPLQQVRAIDEHTAEIVVTATSWPELLNGGPASNGGAESKAGPAPPPVAGGRGSDRPTPGDRKANRLIASEHPQIVRLAAQAAEAEAGEAETALALERLVHRSIRQVNYKTVLGSAADVVERMEGDCTEHAVLLAAMARARGIPSRVAVGLVYVPGLKGFAFHMWTEVHVAGRWMPLDATLGQGGTGPAHLTLLTTNLADDADGDSLAALLPVAQVMGQLEIEVLESVSRD